VAMEHYIAGTTCRADRGPCDCARAGRMLCAWRAIYLIEAGEAKTSKATDEKLATKSTNPKKAMGMAKPPVHLIPGSALIALSIPFKDGAEKYGAFNWRDDPVDVSTYVAAAKRHLDLYFNGQDVVSDSKGKALNLAAVMACCAILIDAEAQGTLIDDRPPAQDLEKWADKWTVGKGL
jgi:hypothetical protein